MTSDDKILLALALQAAYPAQAALDKASALAERFDTLRAVIFADPAQLAEYVSPKAVRAVVVAGRISRRAWEISASTAPILSSPEAAGAYFRARLLNLQVEQVHAAYVNARNAVTVSECVQEGTVDQAMVYPRKIMERALFHKASGFILAHNHPSGDTAPSAQDRQLTDLLAQAARPLGVRFLDHLIIGEGEPFSFRHHGLIPI